MVEIYERHMEGGMRYEHIARVKVLNPDGTRVDVSRQEVVDWLDASDVHKAYAYSRNRQFQQEVIVEHRMPLAYDFIKTRPDGTRLDNLLALPEY